MNYAPCKGCKERYEACHGNCERYLEYKSKSDKEKQAKKEARRADFEMNNYKKQVFRHQGNQKWG